MNSIAPGRIAAIALTAVGAVGLSVLIARGLHGHDGDGDGDGLGTPGNSFSGTVNPVGWGRNSHVEGSQHDDGSFSGTMDRFGWGNTYRYSGTGDNRSFRAKIDPPGWGNVRPKVQGSTSDGQHWSGTVDSWGPFNTTHWKLDESAKGDISGSFDEPGIWNTIKITGHQSADGWKLHIDPPGPLNDSDLSGTGSFGVGAQATVVGAYLHQQAADARAAQESQADD